MLVFHRAPKIHYYSQCVLFNFMSQSFNILNILNILSSGSLTDQRKVWCHMSSPIRHWMRYQPDLVSRIAIEDLCCLRSLLQTSSQHENANAQRVGSPGLRRTARCYVMLVWPYTCKGVYKQLYIYIYMYLCVLVFLFSKLWFWMSLWGEHLLDSKKLKNKFLYFVWSPPWYLYIFSRCCQSGYLLH